MGEAKIEGLEKTLDSFRDTAAAAGAAHAPVDMDQFVTTGEESMDEIQGKNEALLRELEVTIEERTAVETARDLAQNDALSGAGVQAPAAPASGGVSGGASASASASAGGASGGSDGAKGGVSATLSSAQAVISQAAVASSPADNETAAHYDDLRKKLLHTCVSLLEEFDDQRCTKAKELLETAEGDYE